MDIIIKIIFLFGVSFNFLAAMTRDFYVSGHCLQREKDRKVCSLKFSNDEQFLAIAADHYLEIFDFSKKQFIQAQDILHFSRAFDSNISSGSFKFGKFLIKKTGSDIEIWDNSNLYKPYLFGKLHVFNISQCRKYFLTDYAGRFIKVWRYADSSLVDFAIDSSNCREAVFTADSNFILSVNSENVLKVWDFRNKESLTLLCSRSYVKCFALSPSGKYLAVGYTGGNVETYDFSNGLASIDVIPAPISRL